jgi:hypothetical protein
MSTEGKALGDQTRDELNALAKTLGIEKPEKLGTKDDVNAAIEVAQTAQAGQAPPSQPTTKAEQSQVEEVGHPFADAYRYVGPGVVPGVPDHDLAPFDVANIPADVLRDVHFCGFYEPVKEGE